MEKEEEKCKKIECDCGHVVPQDTFITTSSLGHTCCSFECYRKMEREE